METVISWQEAFAHWPAETLPGHCLAGTRHTRGLTQTQLATLCGISQRHISEMEHGKRPIGEKQAKIFAQALHVDYRIFL